MNNRYPSIYHGLRFPRSLSDAFASDRAGCFYHYTRPGLIRRFIKFIRRAWQ